MRNDRNAGGSGFPLTNLYFANTYHEDMVKARSMEGNVKADLKPFMAYLKASIEQIGESTAEGAEVKEVTDNSQELVLEPQFTLINP